MSAAAEERAEVARAAHQAKLVRAEQQAALVQQKKQQQTLELQKRGKLVAMRNQAIHDKRCARPQWCMQHTCVLAAWPGAGQRLFVQGNDL